MSTIDLASSARWVIDLAQYYSTYIVAVWAS